MVWLEMLAMQVKFCLLAFRARSFGNILAEQPIHSINTCYRITLIYNILL